MRHDDDPPGSFELSARPFGRESNPLAQRLLEHIRSWEAHGRPSTSHLHLAAYPREATEIPAATIVDKCHSRLAHNWHPRPDRAP